MAWETVHLPDATVVDKPGGLNNASGYMGLVPARRIAIVLLANRGEYPHEIARYKILPALARLLASHIAGPGAAAGIACWLRFKTESPGRAGAFHARMGPGQINTWRRRVRRTCSSRRRARCST